MFSKIVSLAGFVAADINADFAQFLNGVKPLDEETMVNMWMQFDQEFTSPKLNVVGYEARSLVFNQNVQAIIEHNKGTSSWKKGINMYSDMTEEEFFEHFNIKAIGDGQECSATSKRQSVASPPMRPAEVDWRTRGLVSPVKNQGKCGSCWTFSTVGTLEAHELIAYGNFTSLAEQQLVDCAGDFDNHGCNGGLPSHAFEYIRYAGGISTEQDYPYFATNRNCTVDPDTFALAVDQSVNITAGDEEELADAIFGHGPVSIAFQVVQGFKDYLSGTYSSDVCKNGPGDVNHAVVAVGYGTDSEGVDYWIVKNSWGTSWGNQGYFNIKRGVNMCGVAECNSFPAKVTRISAEAQTLFLQN